MSTDENWMDALSIISDGLPSVTEGCRLPVRMQQQVIMSPPHSKLHIKKIKFQSLKKYILSCTVHTAEDPKTDFRTTNH